MANVYQWVVGTYRERGVERNCPHTINHFFKDNFQYLYKKKRKRNRSETLSSCGPLDIKL